MVLLDQGPALVFPIGAGDPLPDHGVGVDAALEGGVGVVDEGHAAGHAGREIVAHRPEDHGDTAGHVFAPVRAAALDHSAGAGVAHAEALARLAGSEQLAARGTVEDDIADDRVFAGDERARGRHAYDDGAAGKPLAHIVVGVAAHHDLEALHGPGAERLAGGAAQAHREVVGRQPRHAEATGQVGGELGPDRAVRVADRVGELHLLRHFERIVGVADDLLVESVGHRDPALARRVTGVAAGVRLGQQWVEVEIVEIGAAPADLAQEVGAPDDLVERRSPERCQDLAHLLADEGEQVDHLLRRTLELGAERRVLRADAHRAGVAVALAHQDAAHGDQGSGADAELLGSQHGGGDDVAAGLDAAIDAERHGVAQAVEREHLMHFGEAHLPGHAGKFHAALRRRTGATVMAGDQDHVGLGLGDACGDGADAGLCHELDRDSRARVDLLQVVDELREVFDRVDVVVRRRRDERDPRCRKP